MGNLIPNDFKINGELTIKLDRESMALFAMVVIIVVIISLIAYFKIKAA